MLANRRLGMATSAVLERDIATVADGIYGAKFEDRRIELS